MLHVVDLRTEYQHSPMGIDVDRPAFSWRLASDRQAVHQTHYELEVYPDEGHGSPLWTTGVISSPQAFGILYGGPALAPQQRYGVRVRVRDDHQEQSDWSPLESFETGLGAGAVWAAEWITADPPEDLDASTASPLLRTTFELTEVPMAGRLYVTALGLYEIYLNGQRVGDSLFTPGWTNYRDRLQYQVYDVTAHLHVGTNVLGAVLGNGWYRGEIGFQGQRALYGRQRALLLAGYGWNSDGTRTRLVGTDPSWMTRPGPILASEIYHGETYDARAEVEDWLNPHSDLRDWVSVHPVAQQTPIVVAQETVPVQVTETLPVHTVIQTPAGETVLDFGQNLTGRVRMMLDVPRGAEITLQHAEVLDHAGNFYTQNLRSARQTTRYIAKGGGETYAPHFSFQGFRYVKITGYPGTVDAANFQAEVIHSAMESSLSFTCSDPRVNQLQRNIVWGQRGNFLDVPTDCPQRDERLGWTGDAQVFIATAAYNMDVALFFRKWLRDLASEQLPSGSVPHVIPNVMGTDAHGSTGWADAAVIVPWTLYLQYGDRDQLAEAYPSMRAWVEYMRAAGDPPARFEAGNHFGDWLGLDAKPDSYVGATPIPLITQAYYAYSTACLVKAAKALGRTEDQATYEALYDQVVATFQARYLPGSGAIDLPTQTACVLALWMELVPRDKISAVVNQLTASIAAQDGHLATGFLGTPYLLPVLTTFGAVECAYQLLLQPSYPSWLYPLSHGATTIWEHWDGIRPDGSFWSADMNSFNHYAYGAVGQWLYQYAGGIRPDEDYPGFERIRIEPIPGPGLNAVKVGYQSRFGTIRSEWQIADNVFHLEVEIPPNTDATVVLPGNPDPRGVVVPSQAHWQRGVSGRELALGSGTYQFSCPI